MFKSKIHIATISILFLCASCNLTQVATGKQGVNIVEQKLGDTGLKVRAGHNKNTQTVWVALVADLKQLEKKSIKLLNKWFPELNIPVTGK